MKKAQQKQLIILAILLVAALGVYLGLRHINSRPVTISSDRVDLVNLTSLNKIAFTGSDGGELALVKEGESWSVSQLPQFPLDQSVPEQFESLLAGLYVTRSFDQPDALSAYGLEPPAGVVTAETDLGEHVVILVGNEAASGGNYAKVEGEETVSIVSSALAKAMNTDLAGMAQREALPDLSEASLEAVSLTRGEETLTIEKSTRTEDQQVERETGEIGEDGSLILETVTEAVEVYTWSLPDGTVVATDNTALSAALESLSSLAFTLCRYWQPTAEQTAAAGLDSPAAVLTLQGSLGSAVVCIGSLDGTGESYFAAPQGSDRIYLLEAAAVNALLALSEDSLHAESEAQHS